MAEGLAIRRAELSDAPALVAYMADLLAEKLDTISERPAPTLDEERGWLESMLERDRSLILVAADGETVVGVIDITGGGGPQRHAGQLGMSVAKAWRGKGLGRRLLEAAIAEAKTWPDFCRIELDCAPSNEAGVRLYRRCGFLVEGRKMKSFMLRGEPSDMLLMALTW